MSAPFVSGVLHRRVKLSASRHERLRQFRDYGEMWLYSGATVESKAKALQDHAENRPCRAAIALHFRLSGQALRPAARRYNEHGHKKTIFVALTALSPSFLLTSFAALPAMAQDAPADIPFCSYSFDPEHASAEARFTVADITTVASDLAKRILDPDVFDTSDPADTAIIFKSTAVNGVTKPIVRDETFKNAGQHPRSAARWWRLTPKPP